MPTTPPPKWDDWFAFKQPEYYNYDVNDNGTIKHFGTRSTDYSTDVLKSQVQEFIGANAAQGKPPFFAYVAPYAPHGPSTPAPRDKNTFNRLRRLRAWHPSTRPTSPTNPPGYSPCGG